MNLNFKPTLFAGMLVLLSGTVYAQDGVPQAPQADAPAEQEKAPNDARARASDVTPEQAAQILLNALPPEQREKRLKFSFNGTPWKDVLQWFSEEADLSLQVDKPPMGTVNFTDPTRTYSVSEALDLINRLLLDRGYVLVRRGRMLLFVDLEVENAAKLISDIAELVSPEALDKRGRSDIVSCVFSLGNLTPEEAREQLPELVGPAGRVIVVDGPRQVKVTETVDKLLAIRKMLEASQSDVREIKLQYRGAEEVLEAARPLLDLEPGENTSDEIKISVNLFGDRLYATGLPGKISVLESLVTKLDTKLAIDDEAEGETAQPELKTHPVSNADITIVFDVLQTLLQDQPDTRISIEPSSNSVIAMARPSVQERIAKVVAQMDGNGKQLKVLTLRRLDPAQAILTIQKYFGMSEEAEGGAVGPKVDADPATGKLWVRGTLKEIEQIEELIQQLEGEDVLGSLDDRVRILPYTGNSTEDALDQVEMIWKTIGRKNLIDRFPSRGTSDGPGLNERKLQREADRPKEEAPQDIERIDAQTKRRASYRFVSEINDAPAEKKEEPKKVTVTSKKGAPIVVQMTPAGLMIASDDTEALDAFEALLGQFATPTSANADLPEIFWLKYVKAAEVAELVANVLGGADSTMDSMADSLAGGLGGGLGGMVGMMMGGGGGGGSDGSAAKTILTTSGSVTIVSDTRLNALFVQANSTDLGVIQMILEKVDRPDSPEDVQINGKPGLIPVIYHSASDIAEDVKSVFGDRIAGQQSSGGGNRGGQPSPQDFINAIRGGGRGGGGGGQTPQSEHPKINISVDERSNALIVFATPADFEQVRTLVETLDEGGKQVEETVVTLKLPGNLNGEAVIGALEAMLGQEVAKGSEGTATTRTNGQTPGASSSPEDIQRRIQAFQALRGAGGAGGRGGGGAFGGGRGGGGGPGGGGGGRGGGGGPGGGGGGRGR